jgi:deoxyribonuclease-2
MEITRPVVYDHKFAPGADKDFADVSDWAVDKKWNKKDMTTHVTIKSKGGQTFEWFAKSGNWGTRKDLYEHLVAPKLGDLQVEAWRRGAGVWGPACGKSKVLDITEVSFPGKDWGVMNDHSKWALTKSGKHFCVGDINRAKGQDHRGGGTVCIANANFHGQMQKIIQTTDKCGKEEVVLV